MTLRCPRLGLESLLSRTLPAVLLAEPTIALVESRADADGDPIILCVREDPPADVALASAATMDPFDALDALFTDFSSPPREEDLCAADLALLMLPATQAMALTWADLRFPRSQVSEIDPWRSPSPPFTPRL
jgi:hypothetical protein